MRILQLCKKFPFPLKDGESLAVTYLSRALNTLGCEVTLLSMNTTKHYCNVQNLPTHFDHYQQINFVKVDNRINIRDAFVNLFSDDSYHVSRFISPAFRAKLIHLLTENEYDVIQLETLFLAPYISVIRQYSNALIVMRSHNVEHEIWERVARNTKFFPTKWYLQYLAVKLRRYEVARLPDYDLLVAITKRDLQQFRQLGYRKAAMVTPIGIKGDDYQPDYKSFKKPPSIGFIGSLDWMPNQEGLEWFLQNVWSAVVLQFPELKLHIAGRNAPKRILNLNMANVIVHGEVPDAKAFINQHSLMVVPLLSGSGIRVKILEGMALGRVVLTTSVGLEGIDARHEKEVLIADTKAKFLEAIQFCVEHPSQLQSIGQRARTFVEKEFDNLTIALQLVKMYQRLRSGQKKRITYTVPGKTS